MAGDMLVKLYDLPEERDDLGRLRQEGIAIKRALSADKLRIVQYVKEEFHDGWLGECEAAFAHSPIGCFVAVKDKKAVGFACYDATAKGFFGPTGVSVSCRGRGIGKSLLLSCLYAMREEGYAYAIIGWADGAIDFYKNAVNAQLIEGSLPGVYGRMVEA